MVLPPAIRPDFHCFFSTLLCSRVYSTAKKYLKEINKFLLWCRTRKIALQLLFSSSVVALYLFGLDQQLRSPAAMVLVHAALKWFHSFVPDDGPNPLDNACCKNLIECAKRTRCNPVHKKKPVDSAIIRSIIDIGVRAGGARGAAVPPNFGQLRFFGQQEKIWAKPAFKDVFMFFY